MDINTDYYQLINGENNIYYINHILYTLISAVNSKDYCDRHECYRIHSYPDVFPSVSFTCILIVSILILFAIKWRNQSINKRFIYLWIWYIMINNIFAASFVIEYTLTSVSFADNICFKQYGTHLFVIDSHSSQLQINSVVSLCNSITYNNRKDSICCLSDYVCIIASEFHNCNNVFQCYPICNNPVVSQTRISNRKLLATTNAPSLTPTTPTTPPTSSPSTPPSNAPSFIPTSPPSIAPSVSPTTSPTNSPLNAPTNMPTTPPSNTPSKTPTIPPTNEPSFAPTTPPTNTPSLVPTNPPTSYPSFVPTTPPSNTPSISPTTPPTNVPSNTPTQPPSLLPTNSPTTPPSNSPSLTPTSPPTNAPSLTPTLLPSISPTTPPTHVPSQTPTSPPSLAPTISPTTPPTNIPSNTPTQPPSLIPSNSPTTSPSQSPSFVPTTFPTNAPSLTPSLTPSISPTTPPTNAPSKIPTSPPTLTPTISPTNVPSNTPTQPPSLVPSNAPTTPPSNSPSFAPTSPPTMYPSLIPSSSPSISPTTPPTNVPSLTPSLTPSISPTIPPSNAPSKTPTYPPTLTPTISPTNVPSNTPTQPPTLFPTNAPTLTPSNTPSQPPTSAPSLAPSLTPSLAPTSPPTITPSSSPTTPPSLAPSLSPTTPPSNTPSLTPSLTPSVAPTTPPTNAPSLSPTLAPSIAPTTPPTNAPSNTPSQPPTLSPSLPPTPYCATLFVTVMDANTSFNAHNFNGIYTQTSQIHHGKQIWQVGSGSNDQNILGYSGSWVINGKGISSLSHLTNSQFPPINDLNAKWTHSNVPNKEFHVDITCQNTYVPTNSPTNAPTAYPTNVPSNYPTNIPSNSPSQPPTATPSLFPSNNPSQPPTNVPSQNPTRNPSSAPSNFPTISPSLTPSISPSIAPSVAPSNNPSQPPTNAPSIAPTAYPSNVPTVSPSFAPTPQCSTLYVQTFAPYGHENIQDNFNGLYTFSADLTNTNAYGRTAWSVVQIANDKNIQFENGNEWVIHGIGDATLSFMSQSQYPPNDFNIDWSHSIISGSFKVHINCIHSFSPTDAPSISPTISPSFAPTTPPSVSPSIAPSISPSVAPSLAPTSAPSLFPSLSPSIAPSNHPSISPSVAPSLPPSVAPTLAPSIAPTSAPTLSPSIAPSNHPTSTPSVAPSLAPSIAPSLFPSLSPTTPPTNAPSLNPSVSPSIAPSNFPTVAPSLYPTLNPTHSPSNNPTMAPSLAPSIVPSLAPSVFPSYSPSIAPTRNPIANDDFDSFISVKYFLDRLTKNNFDYIIGFPLDATSQIKWSIKRGYFGGILKFKDFDVEIERINNIKMQYMQNEKNQEKISEWDSEEIQIQTKIRCKNEPIQKCELIKERSDGYGSVNAEGDTNVNYINKIQNILRDEFDNQELEFSILNSDKLKIQCANCEETETISLELYVFYATLCVCGIVLFVTMFAYLFNKGLCLCCPCCHNVDDARWPAVLLFALQFWDFWSDLFLTAEIWNRPDILHQDNIIIFIAGCGSSVFVVMAYIINLGIASKVKSSTIKKNHNAESWFRHNSTFFTILVVLTGGAYSALALVSSGIFGLKLFTSRLTQYELKLMLKYKVFGTVIIENIPQLLCQALYSYSYGFRDIPPAVYVAFVASALSVIATTLNYCIQKDNQADTKVAQYYLSMERVREFRATANHQFRKNTGKIAIGNVSPTLRAIGVDEKKKFSKHRGMRQKLGYSISQVFRKGPKDIEIGFSTISNTGIICHVVHYLYDDELEMQVENNKVRQISEPLHYVKKLYKRHQEDINLVFRNHFNLLLDDSFEVSFQEKIGGNAFEEMHLNNEKKPSMLQLIKNKFSRQKILAYNNSNKKNVYATPANQKQYMTQEIELQGIQEEKGDDNNNVFAFQNSYQLTDVEDEIEVKTIENDEEVKRLKTELENDMKIIANQNKDIDFEKIKNEMFKLFKKSSIESNEDTMDLIVTLFNPDTTSGNMNNEVVVGEEKEEESEEESEISVSQYGL